MQMDIKFELKPKQRPKLAEEIATALHTVLCYQKAPSLAYKIGDCTLERDGTLRIPDSVDRETVNSLLEHLKDKGFTGEAEQTEDRLTVSIPRELFTQGELENLAKLVENKGGLMARAFQADEIRLTVTEDIVSFDRLRELKQKALTESAEREGLKKRIAEMKDFLNSQTVELLEYDEQLVRRLVERVTVYEEKFEVEFKSGVEMDVNR